METVTALILLPVEYNPDEKRARAGILMKEFVDTAMEIEALFREYGLGCTIDPYPKLGVWADLGVVYEDVNVLIEIDSFPEKEKEKLLAYCRDTLLGRFKQKAIQVRFVPRVEATIVSVSKCKGGA